MSIFAAHEKFGPWSGESWANYIKWSGLHHIAELVSTDTMLCPPIINELIDTDWQYNIHEDYKTYFFRDFEYLKARIGYDSDRHNLLSLTEHPVTTPQTPEHFEFCGYDILDSYDSISVLTNCGGFPTIFTAADINRFGLLDDVVRANQIAKTIREAEPDDPHCFDCRVWALARYAAAS